MPLVVPWLAVTCPPFTVTSTPLSVFATGLERSIATSVANELFSRASSSSGKYSVAVAVGSADDSSMDISNVASSPLVVELPLPPFTLPPLFQPLLSSLMNSSIGSSAEQHISISVDATSIVKNKNLFFIRIHFFVRCKDRHNMRFRKNYSASPPICSTKPDMARGILIGLWQNQNQSPRFSPCPLSNNQQIAFGVQFR